MDMSDINFLLASRVMTDKLEDRAKKKVRKFIAQNYPKRVEFLKEIRLENTFDGIIVIFEYPCAGERKEYIIRIRYGRIF